MVVFIFKIVFGTLIIGMLIYWVLLIQKQKVRFQNKENQLISVMHRMTKIQQDLNDRVKIAEDFEKNYQQSRAKIAQSIYEMNRSLFEKLLETNKNSK